MERVGSGTWFAIDRKIFSSDLWFSSPWKLKIFIYLLGHANHESNNFMGIELNRGELIRSYRTIAKDCGYKIGYRLKQPSLDTVRRICEELTKELRIQQRTVHQGTIFTIINYNELQPVSKQRIERRTVKQSYSDRTATVQDNNKEELIKNKNIGGNGIPDWIPAEIWADFKEFRIRKKAPLTARAIKGIVTKLESLRLSGNDPESVLEQSIVNGWAGVFEIKKDFKKSNNSTRSERVASSMDIMARREYERQREEAEIDAKARNRHDTVEDVQLLPD
jgi:hypothetical protein